MKFKKHLLSALIIGASITAITSTSMAAPPTPPAEMESWLKSAQLGSYDTGKHDWAEIEKKANEEGEVVIYSASSRMAKVGKKFTAIYPNIKVTSYDLGSVKTIEKTVREQDANIFGADIITTGNSGQVIHELWNKNRIVSFVPDTHADRIPSDLKSPVLVRILEAVVFMYNGEAHDQAPASNIWEFTEPKWKGKVVMKDPLASGTTFMAVATLIEHADDLAGAYKRHTGKDIVLSKGIKDAGYEFVYRFLKNDVVILKSGSKAVKASGKKGQANPPVSFGAMTYLRYNKKKKLVNKLIVKLDPMAKIIYPTFTAIARQAPHPNAAKLFTRYVLGSTDLNMDSKIEKPFTKGKSLELLQGLSYYFDPGSKSPRDDVPFPPGGEEWPNMKAWTVNPDFLYSEGPKVRDFWIQELAQ